MSNLISFESLLWETADKGFEKCMEYSTKLCEKYNIEIDTSYWTEDNYIPKLANFISSLSEDYLQEKKKKKKPYSSRRDGMFDPDLGVKMFNRAAGTDSSSDGSSGAVSGAGDSGGDGGGMSEALLDEANPGTPGSPPNGGVGNPVPVPNIVHNNTTQPPQPPTPQPNNNPSNRKKSSLDAKKSEILKCINEIRNIKSGKSAEDLRTWDNNLRQAFSQSCKNEYSMNDDIWDVVYPILTQNIRPLTNQFIILTQKLGKNLGIEMHAENYKTLYNMWSSGEVNKNLSGKLNDKIPNFYFRPELWNRSQEDFKYTVRILDVVTHNDKLDDFFSNPDSIDKNLLLNNNRIKDAGINQFKINSTTNIGENIYSVVAQWDNSMSKSTKKKDKTLKQLSDEEKIINQILNGTLTDANIIRNMFNYVRGNNP